MYIYDGGKHITKQNKNVRTEEKRKEFVIFLAVITTQIQETSLKGTEDVLKKKKKAASDFHFTISQDILIATQVFFAERF